MKKLYTFLAEIKSINPKADVIEIRRAYDFAKKIYGSSKRLSGQPVLDHCLEIAISVVNSNLDIASIQAAILHETIEKFDVTALDIKKHFGADVAKIVEGISNVSKIEHHGAQRSIENLRKLFLAMGEDLRVIIIKLINRTHGLKTMGVFSEEKQKRMAQETLEIYAPLAHRLGMGHIQSELEDLAFPYAHSLQYQWLASQTNEQFPLRQKIVERIKAQLAKELKKEKIKVLDIYGRTKHLYSLWRKLQKYDMDMSQIYDLVALRIIVENVGACYHALGIIHKLYKPLPGRIKDYIASPKPNGYQSIHTTVFCADGEVIEIQIRTAEMHQKAEFGVAAHWYYSEKKGLITYLKKKILGTPPEKELKWIQELRLRQEKITPQSTNIEDLKIDFFKGRIFVFTPRGDIIDLPKDATPIDFAYYIHTAIGNTCTGAKINGKLSSLSTQLKNGDIIEIITQKTGQPNRKWLQIVKTSLAKHRIKHFLKTQEDLATIVKKEIPTKIAAKTALGLLQKKEKNPQINSVAIKDTAHIMTKFAKCCQPKYPDTIIGYITPSRGLTIHRSDCAAVAKTKNSQRLLPLEWQENQ